MQEVLETGGDDEEEKGRKEGTLSEMHLQGVVSRRDLRWMREGHCRCVSGSEGSVHYAGMEQTSAKTLAWY